MEMDSLGWAGKALIQVFWYQGTFKAPWSDIVARIGPDYEFGNL